MGAAKSLLKLAESERWEDMEKFLKEKSIANEAKLEHIRYRDKYRGTPLQAAIYRRAPVYIMVLLVDIGGDDILSEQDPGTGFNALHHAAIAGSISNEALKLIIRVGGVDILPGRDMKGKIPLMYSIDRYGKPDFRLFRILLKEGILHNIGGEYGMGGLWMQDNNGLSTLDYLIKHRSVSWGAIRRRLSEIAKGMPLLHGAIVHNIHPDLIKRIISEMPWSTRVRDKSGRLPIHVAAERGLTWGNGLEDIFKGYADAIEILDSRQHTKLYPFAIAAIGKNNDLDTVYSMLRSCVHMPLR